MVRLLVFTLAVLAGLAGMPSSVSADEVLWMRKSTFGGQSAIAIGTDGELYCTGCNFNNYGPIPIQREVGIPKTEIANLHPWMSTLWVVLFRVEGGNRCEGEFYTVSLNTHLLEHVNKGVLGCRPVTISVADKGLGMVITFVSDKGGRVVVEVK